MNKRSLFLLLTIAMVLVGCSGAGTSGGEGIIEGNRAKDFTLESLEHGRVSLSDYRGQVVLINFWATWCPPCQAEIPDLEAAYRAHKESGFVVLGVNVQEDPSVVEPFLQSMEMTYPVLLDREGDVFRLYRTPGLPMSLILDRKGVILVRHVGYLSGDMLDDYLAEAMSSS